ncbi:MAG: N-acetylneuraminate synthase family protein [Leptospiraceae bacterium]|nr:N-acetylneuraminate synthase family protein [Leptospiraceae bacterium]MDW8306361.1 N-acetylneuraminate synthase family protein [Leptospiraceae bacterium]
MSHFFATEITLNFRGIKKTISPNERPLLVAEIGLNHNKDRYLLQEIIYKAKECGADAIKLQSYKTSQFIHPDIPTVKGLYDIFERYELSEEDHEHAAEQAEKAGLLFFSTPLSPGWSKYLEKIKSAAIKIASGDINNWQLLEEASITRLPLIISTGAAKAQAIHHVVRFCRERNLPNTVLLHCVSLYPTPLEKANLQRLVNLKEEFQILTGFSDHTLGTEAAFAAAILGAVIVEKHFTLNKTLPGPDHAISADPPELKELRRKLDLAFLLRGKGGLSAHEEEFHNDFWGKRSLYNTPQGILALRPRQNHLPLDSEYYTFVKTHDQSLSTHS